MLEKTIRTDRNFVPDIVNPSPDYYCTWQTQLYATSDGKPRGQRAVITENSLFSNDKPFGWAHFYETARRDLYIIMDDSWDVPIEDDPAYYGSLILNSEKFPEAVNGAADNAEALESLVKRIKALGWKGLGGWVCAQESEALFDGGSPEEYWKQRIIDSARSGFGYWKVDWGKKAGDADFRRMLTGLGRKYAPNLVIEHAMIKEVIPFSDTYRTYDVPALMSIPMTMEKLREYSDVPGPESGNLGLINCEDEVYIAAAGGFSMGVMRHPYAGALPDGRADMSFPCVHRNLKTKMTEVARAVRWHRMAPAFGVDRTQFNIDTVELCDTWRFEDLAAEIEKWWIDFMPPIRDHITGNVLKKTAPARISRNCELPYAAPDKEGNVPYIVASKNPNGAFSVVTLGRTSDRNYYIPACDVTVKTDASRVIGVFGEYASLTLDTSLDTSEIKVFAQDLADDTAYDITLSVTTEGGKIIVPGEVIHQLGTLAQPEGDTSEPGLVIVIE